MCCGLGATAGQELEWVLREAVEHLAMVSDEMKMVSPSLLYLATLSAGYHGEVNIPAG
jgi:hypothetical protein